MAIVKKILSKQHGLNPLARYPYSTPIQVVLSAITFVALTALVTGLLDLFLIARESNPGLPDRLILIIWLGVPFMLGLIVHRRWAVLITPAALVLSPLVHDLWQCQAQFSCLGDYAYDQELETAPSGLLMFIVWISMPIFCGWLGFKLRG